jgi:hypothetical protein
MAPGFFPRRGTYYDVRLRDERGRFVADPLRDYARGRRVVTVAELCETPLVDGDEKP